MSTPSFRPPLPPKPVPPPLVSVRDPGGLTLPPLGLVIALLFFIFLLAMRP